MPLPAIPAGEEKTEKVTTPTAFGGFTRSVAGQAGQFTGAHAGEEKPKEPAAGAARPPEKAETKGTGDKAADQTEPASSPEELKITQRLANLAHRERQLTERARVLNRQAQEREARVKETEAKIAAAQAEIAQMRTRMETARADPLRWLEIGGHTYEGASRQMLNAKKPLPEQEIQAEREARAAEVEQLRKDMQARDTRDAEERAKAETAARRAEEARTSRELEQFKEQTVEFVKATPDKYELITRLEVEHEVPELIIQHYQQTLETARAELETQGKDTSQAKGQLLTRERAAELLEEYYRKKSEAVLETSYFKSKYQPITPAAPSPTKAPSAPAKNQPTSPAEEEAQPARGVFQRIPFGQHPTITSQIVTQGGAPVNGEKVFLTDEERMARAIAKFKAVKSEREATRG